MLVRVKTVGWFYRFTWRELAAHDHLGAEVDDGLGVAVEDVRRGVHRVGVHDDVVLALLRVGGRAGRCRREGEHAHRDEDGRDVRPP